VNQGLGTMRPLKTRVQKLETARSQRAYPYVIRASNPMTPEELDLMQANARARRHFALMPHRCKSMNEWLVRYPTGNCFVLRSRMAD
jgi:hypothetical protein